MLSYNILEYVIHYNIMSHDVCFIITSYKLAHYKYVVVPFMYVRHLCNTYIKIYIICI